MKRETLLDELIPPLRPKSLAVDGEAYPLQTTARPGWFWLVTVGCVLLWAGILFLVCR